MVLAYFTAITKVAGHSLKKKTDNDTILHTRPLLKEANQLFALLSDEMVEDSNGTV